MSNTLIDPSDLVGFPGAPFSDAEVDAAAAAIRGAAGWHIAPVEVETSVPLDVAPAEPVLRLPTRKLVSVEAVRDADSATLIAATSYRVSRARGRVRRTGGYWPSGYERVEVDFTHGYDDLPLDLLPIVAQVALLARRDSTIQSVRVDDASVSFLTAGTATAAASVTVAFPSRYLWPEWTGMA